MRFTDRKNDNVELVSENGMIINKITEFLKKNVKYVSRTAMIFALASVLMLTGCNEKNDGKEPDQAQDGQEVSADNAQQPTAEKDEYEVDAQPEVKELISTYYNSYAAGDIDKLVSITQFLSDMEKSYIQMMNEHVESYSDVTCYTKEGLEEGSYLVSVAFNMHFSGVEGGLPGLDFYYLRTSEDGKLYIDNRYSAFNRLLQEQETEAEIDSLIAEFQAGEDVQKLRAEFDEKYKQAEAADENLKSKADAVSDAIRQWRESYSPDAPKEEGQPEENAEAQPEENTENTDAKPEESSEENTEQPSEETAENTDAETPEEDSTPEINYVPEGKVLTASSSYNVRKSMNESAELVGTTAEGDSIKVILSYAEGWTKVEWNGQTGYIRTDLLLNN